MSAPQYRIEWFGRLKVYVPIKPTPQTKAAA